MESFGKIAFYAGLVISVLVGVMDLGTWVPIALVVLGLIVGFLNISEKEAQHFLLATVALVISGLALGGKFGIMALDKAIAAYVLFTAAAAFIVALMAVWHMQKGR
jgi:hypothetical protein